MMGSGRGKDSFKCDFLLYLLFFAKNYAKRGNDGIMLADFVKTQQRKKHND